MEKIIAEGHKCDWIKKELVQIFSENAMPVLVFQLIYLLFQRQFGRFCQHTNASSESAAEVAFRPIKIYVLCSLLWRRQFWFDNLLCHSWEWFILITNISYLQMVTEGTFLKCCTMLVLSEITAEVKTWLLSWVNHSDLKFLISPAFSRLFSTAGVSVKKWEKEGWIPGFFKGNQYNPCVPMDYLAFEIVSS